MELKNISKEHFQKLNVFDCGNGLINKFIKKTAYHSHMTSEKATKVMIADEKIIGFYTMMIKGVEIAELLEEDTLKIISLEYIAIDSEYQGLGLGKELIYNFLSTAYSIANDLALSGIMLNAVPNKISWYEKVGFNDMKKDNQEGLRLMFIDLRTDEYMEYMESFNN